MKRKKILVFTALVLFAMGGLVIQFHGSWMPALETKGAVSGLGGAKELMSTYGRWKAWYTQIGGDKRLSVPLRHFKGLSNEFTRADGRMTIHLPEGSVSVKVSGLTNQRAYEVWLIDNRPGQGHSVKPEPGDAMVNIGRLANQNDPAGLQTRLDPKDLKGFEIDLVAVARYGEGPGEGGILFGSPSLFQRLYYNEGNRSLVKVGRTGEALSAHQSRPPASLGFLVPALAFAAQGSDAASLLESLVAQGEQIFFNERFEGNGRTCGTCHPAQNNFTIDPVFISTLPGNDPLFVAEFDPNLAELERPELMRQFGMILENVDGFDRPGVMRGVPHTLALSTSITPPAGFPLANTTGWSGDGAPGDGSLRSFATGAVIQHFPKTLDRVPGQDFRLPTDEELDALEAFQLSLGRQEDLKLDDMIFTSAVVELGKELFNSTAEGTGKCIFCHSNAGANVAAGFNANINTGVEELPSQPARLVDPTVPRDGGFGSEPDGLGGFGDGTFNTPAVVEAADTPPFFHNNSVNTVEASVAFFNSDAFNESPGGVFTGGISRVAQPSRGPPCIDFMKFHKERGGGFAQRNTATTIWKPGSLN